MKEIEAARRMASGLLQIRTGVGSLPRIIRQMLKDLRPAVRELQSLTHLEVHLSSAPAGREIRRHLAERRYGLPTARAVAVLELPEQPELYSQGRHRQALRTNCTKARAAGLSTRRVTREELQRTVLSIRDEGKACEFNHLDALMKDRDLPGKMQWLAVGEGNEPLAIGMVCADQETAWISYLVAAKGSDNSAARYLLSADIIEELCRRGIRHVLVGSTVFLPPGLLYFQRLLGFTTRRLTVTSTRRPECHSPR